MKFTRLKTTVILAFAVLIVVFTLQNTEVITIKLWFWKVNTSSALIIVVSIVAGIIFGMMIPCLRKNKRNADQDQDRSVLNAEGETNEKD